MKKLIARCKTLGPKQLVSVAVVLPITFIGALVLLWVFLRYNRRISNDTAG